MSDTNDQAPIIQDAETPEPIRQVESEAVKPVTEDVDVETTPTNTLSGDIEDADFVMPGLEDVSEKEDILSQVNNEEERAEYKRILSYEEPQYGSNVTMADNYRRERKPSDKIGVKFGPEMHLTFLPGTINAVNRAVLRSGNVNDLEGYKRWEAALGEAHALYNRDDRFESTVTESGEWDQGLIQDGKRYRIGMSRLPFESGVKISGYEAAARVSRALDMGEIVMIPLYHSGFWISLKAPTNAALYELESRIAKEKITIGRMTKGYIFSNTAVITTSLLLDFIMDHVYDTNAPHRDKKWLMDNIKITDIPTLAWGMACTIYPNGYPMEQPCTANPQNCTYVDEAMVELTKLQWVNNSALTEEQRILMARRTSKRTEDEIHKYQNGFIVGESKRQVKLNDKLTVCLTVPSLSLYVDSGSRWIEGLREAMEMNYGGSNKFSERDRDAYITDMASTVAARQYSHWIERIETTEVIKGIDNVAVVEDLASIEQSTALISSSIENRRKLITAVGEYIDAVTVAVIGIVNAPCVKCGELVMQGKTGAFSRIINIDAVMVFLTLQRQKLDQVLEDQGKTI